MSRADRIADYLDGPGNGDPLASTAMVEWVQRGLREFERHLERAARPPVEWRRLKNSELKRDAEDADEA